MLKVFCARSMHVAVAALSGQFAKNASTAPDIVFEPMGALQARIAADETANVLILAAPATDALARSGALISDSRADVARADYRWRARYGYLMRAAALRSASGD